MSFDDDIIDNNDNIKRSGKRRVKQLLPKKK